MLSALLEKRLLDSLGDVVVITDEQGLIITWNFEAERVFGWTTAEVLQQPVQGLWALSRLGPAASAASTTIAARGTWRGEIEVPDRDGRPVTVDVEVSRIALAEGDQAAPQGYLAIGRDISALKRAAQALRDSEVRLRESEERFRNLVEQKQVGVYLVQDNRFQYVNPKFAEIVGYERAEILAFDHFLVLVHSEDKAYVAERQRQRLLGESSAPYSFRLQRKNGELAHVEVYGTRTQYLGSPSIIGSLVDVTERTRVQEALRESEARYRALVDSLSEGILLVDRDGQVMTCNESAARLLGLSAGQRKSTRDMGEGVELFRESMAKMPPEEWPGLHTLRTGTPLTDVVIGLSRPGRELTWLLFNTRPLHRASEALPYAVVVSIVDVTDRKRAEDELHRQAFYDKLTGLPNRALFHDRVERAISQARRNDQLVAVCFIDLDRFKQVNDTLGHAVGDVFLQQVAQRLSRCLREGDTVARMGGDEFTLLLPALTDAEDALRVAERVLAVLRQPFYVGPHLLRITASVGISLCPQDGLEVAELLKHADAAMYRVKSAGKDGYQLCTVELTAAASRRLNLEAQLWRALTEKRLRLSLLPVIDLSNGELLAIDTSPRWPHPTEGLIVPRDISSLSEDSDLTVGLTRWTLRQACVYAQTLSQAGLPPMGCVVSLPPRQLLRRELCSDVRAALEESGLVPTRLLLVLQLDRQVIQVADLMDLAAELHQLGVLLVLDGVWDAGLPLQYLHALPLKAIRLEARLVQHLGSAPKGPGLCEGLISMAHSLGLTVIAEGVDSASELATLKRLGCDFAAGASVTWPRSFDPGRSALIESLQREGGSATRTG